MNNVSPIKQNVNYYNNQIAFGHGHSLEKSPYSKKEKAVIAGTTALGVATSLACLAKKANYSLNPTKMFKNIKQSYLAKVDFELKEIVSIGVGTCLGGLAGGYLVDKDKQNRKAKRREAILQLGNISIPIATVHYFHEVGQHFGKVGEAVSSIAGIFTGVYLANYLMNKLGNVLFHNRDGRGVKPADFSAHLDDAVVSASYISKSDIIKFIGRFVPVALMVAGNEVGNKVAPNHVNQD